ATRLSCGPSALIDRLQAEPNYTERVRIMREELGPWLYEYMPAVSIGPTHSIVVVGPHVGDWPLIPGHMGLHNWEYISRAREPVCPGLARTTERQEEYLWKHHLQRNPLCGA